jgi:hypothetical protein
MTVELTDQIKTARRLLGSSSKNSDDPQLDIDWAAPLIDGLAYLPPEHGRAGVPPAPVRWMGEKIRRFLDENGMVSGATRPIYRAAHLL